MPGLDRSAFAAGLDALRGRSPVLPVPEHAATVAARRRFFGADVVDPDSGAVRADRVVVSWFGCASFAVALGGTVVLLDAWVPRGATGGYVPTTPAEVAALRPAAIFLGHGHFDHAADAGPIAAASGATVFGTTQHCAAARADAPAATFHCVELGAAGDPPGTMANHELGPISVTAVQHLHSALSPRDDGPQGSPGMRWQPPNLGSILRHPPRLPDVLNLCTHLTDPCGGTLLYQFRVGNFTLTWHDSSGPLLDNAPQVLDTLRALPRTDLHLGAIQGYNQYRNGLRDPRTYIEALRPKVFAPCHHDNWLPLITTDARAYHEPLLAELNRIPPAGRPQLAWLADRADYLAPARLTFALR
ncbi:MBL fold metallo-hydrolase [Nocardia stercoris]|uniref:MBL fold metallo-hydrolase n=1 Tax=Nocardia stercoris TaxID=2483361 RepID=A0A3M2LD20_9NOCA|nr:MBL fold metallo-hydrolase [Nocardia stercoris]RMI35372.1 MBL fold metallo-hydrolase [Nocardia stercoris]